MKLLCIGRGFIGKALAKRENVDVIAHQAFLREYSAISGYDAFINTSGIVGDFKCQHTPYDEVHDANTLLPRRFSMLARHRRAKFFQLSSTGMYIPQACPIYEGYRRPDESSKIKSYNRYVASKVHAEELLMAAGNAFILRTPLIEDELSKRSEKWEFVQDTYLSLVDMDFIYDVICRIVKKSVPYGIYNISQKTVYLPDHIYDLTGRKLPLRSKVPETMTSAVPVDITKAVRADIIGPEVFQARRTSCPECNHYHSIGSNCRD